MRKLSQDVATQEMREAGLEPQVPYPGSARKWECVCLSCGQTVFPRHSSIKQGHGGCNFCAQRASQKKQRLEPQVAEEMMRKVGLEPLEPYKSSKSRWLCRCTRCGIEAYTSHSNVKQGHGCKKCEMTRASEQRRLSNAANAVLTMQAAGLEPLEDYPGTVRKWKCRCLECGQTVTPTHDKVMQTGRGCTSCSLRVRGLERRLNPEEAANVMRVAGLEPLIAYPTALQPWPCRCTKCGRTVDPTLASVKRGARCRFCSGKDVVPEEAVDVLRSAGVEPLEAYPGANVPWSCRCTRCGRNPKPSYGYVRRTGNGCGYCSGRHVDPDEAVQIMRKHDFEPLKPYPGSLKPWSCRCRKCGKKSAPRFATVKSKGTRCRYCQGIAVDPKDAERLMRKAGFIPLVPYPGASKPWRCKCKKCKKEVSPTIGTVRAGGGCRYCATKGIDLNSPAIV